MSSGGDLIRSLVPVAAAIATIAFAPAGWAAWAVAGAATAASLAASIAVNAVMPIAKPDTSFDFDWGASNLSDRTQTVRQPITSRRIIYGRVRTGGVYTFIESTRDREAPSGGQVAGKTYLHMIVTVAGHPVEAFESLYLDDQEVPIAMITGVGTGTPVVSGADQTGYSLVTTGWTPSQTGILKEGDWIEIEGKKYEIQADANSDGSGNATFSVQPALKAETSYTYVSVVTGYDDRGNPKTGIQRVATVAHHADAAEITLVHGQVVEGDYAGFVEVWFGDGTTEGDADLHTALNASCPDTWTTGHLQTGCAKAYLRLKWNANAFPSGLPSPSFVVQGKKVYDPRTTSTAYSANAALCIQDYLTSGMGVSADLLECPVDEWSAEANICDESVSLADGGSENRYECNGVVDMDSSPKKILQSLLSSCAGRLVRSNGQWLLYVGAYRTPSVALTIDDLDGPIKVSTRISRRDLYNGVKGTFVDPEQSWQATDFPSVQVAEYLAEDQDEEIWKDVTQEFCTSSAMAQRVARIELERGRRQITVNLSCKLTAYQAMTGETVTLTVDRYGWDAKVFEVMGWSFAHRDGEDGAPRIGIDLTLRETDSGVFSWTSAQEQATNRADATNLPNPREVSAPTDLVVSESLFVTRDGSGVKNRVVLSWTASTDGFTSRYEAQYQPAIEGAAAWKSIGTTDQTSIPVEDVTPGSQQFRVRAVNSFGAASSWVTQDVAIDGLSAVPADIEDLSLQIIGDQAHLTWALSTDLDVRVGGKIRVRHSNQTDGSATWTSAQNIGPSVAGNATSAVLPALSGTYLVKAVDSYGAGQESENAATAITTAPSLIGLNAVETVDEASGGWAGPKTGVYVDDDGALCLAGTDEIDDWSSVDAVLDWDIGEAGLEQSGAYNFEDTLDLGGVVTSRLTAEMEFLAYDLYDSFDARTDFIDSWPSFDGGDFSDTGARLYVRTTSDDPSGSPTWGAWAQFYVGDYTARAFQFKIELYRGDASHQVAISALSVTVDMPDRIQSGQGLTIAAAGTAVTYSAPFYATPTVGVTVGDMATGDRLVLSGESETGFTWRVLDSGGSGVERTGNYIAQGY